MLPQNLDKKYTNRKSKLNFPKKANKGSAGMDDMDYFAIDLDIKGFFERERTNTIPEGI